MLLFSAEKTEFPVLKIPVFSNFRPMILMRTCWADSGLCGYGYRAEQTQIKDSQLWLVDLQKQSFTTRKSCADEPQNRFPMNYERNRHSWVSWPRLWICERVSFFAGETAIGYKMEIDFILQKIIRTSFGKKWRVLAKCDEFWQKVGHSVGNYKNAKTGAQWMSLMAFTQFQFLKIPVFSNFRPMIIGTHLLGTLHFAGMARALFHRATHESFPAVVSWPHVCCLANPVHMPNPYSCFPYRSRTKTVVHNQKVVRWRTTKRISNELRT